MEREDALLDPRNLERRPRKDGRRGKYPMDQKRLVAGERGFGRWLRYHLYVPESDPGDRLLVSFASSRPDTPPVYAFPGVLSSQGCAVLFVRSLDGYWFGFDREPVVFEEAVELVGSTIAERSVAPGDVIACGSSLGGQGALHVGSRCGLGRVLVGTPIIFLGSFLLERPFGKEQVRRVMAETMVGTARLGARVPRSLVHRRAAGGRSGDADPPLQQQGGRALSRAGQKAREALRRERAAFARAHAR
jgi:hypothetical protein